MKLLTIWGQIKTKRINSVYNEGVNC
jgi:hypothetical protein